MEAHPLIDCPECVWKRLHILERATLEALYWIKTDRVAPAVRIVLTNHKLIEFRGMGPDGALWSLNTDGLKVLKAGEGMGDVQLNAS